MGYCCDPARAAPGAGAKISTGERATKLRRDGGLWQIETDHGTLTAKAVILGTNAYTDNLWPAFKRIFTMIHYFQLVTAQLGLAADHILPGRQRLWDTVQIMFNIRCGAYNSLLVGGMGKVVGSKDKDLSHSWARKQIAQIFPSPGPMTFEKAWHGKIAMTPDHLPRIYELADNLFMPIGYSGCGITAGTMFGQTMADLLPRTDRADLPPPMTDMSTVPSAPIMSPLYQMAFTAKQVLEKHLIMNENSIRVGVYIGGAFTDVAPDQPDGPSTCKVLTKAAQPERAIRDGIAEAAAPGWHSS